MPWHHKITSFTGIVIYGKSFFTPVDIVSFGYLNVFKILDLTSIRRKCCMAVSSRIEGEIHETLEANKTPHIWCLGR